MPNRQVWGSSTNWRASSGSWASPWASVVRWGSRSRTASAAVSAARRRGEQPEGAAVGGVDQLDDLVELGLPEPVAAGRRQVAGDVEDRLLAVVERRADVDARATAARSSPLRRPGSPSTTRSAGLSPTLVATALKSPPSISVALVNTTVLSVSSLSRIGPHTWSGATHSRGGIRSPPSASQSTSASTSAAIRSAVTNTSCTEPLAWVRPASRVAVGVGLLGVGRQAGARGVADQRQRVARAGRAAGRTGPARAAVDRVGAARRRRRPGRRPGRPRRGAATAGRPARRRRRAARRWRPGSPGRTSSWASSITTAS